MKLNENETKIIRAIRNLNAAAARLPELPPELLELGTVTVSHTAKLLGLEPREVRQLAVRGELPVIDGGVPCSEVRRFHAKLNRVRLQHLVRGVTALFEPAAARHCWLPEMMGGAPRGYSAKHAAEETGLSQREIRRMVADDRLFAWSTPRRGLVITTFELQALERHLARQSQPQGITRGITRQAA